MVPGTVVERVAVPTADMHVWVEVSVGVQNSVTAGGRTGAEVLLGGG